MIIRAAWPADIKRIYELNKECHPIPSPDWYLQSYMDSGSTWVAEIDGRVVGFLVAALSRTGLTPHVSNVAVSCEYTRQGIATELFKVFEESYKMYDEFDLYVDASNPALKLYFDLGYRVVDVLKDFYGEKKDGLRMVKARL